jgi:hypothetical protein
MPRSNRIRSARNTASGESNIQGNQSRIELAAAASQEIRTGIPYCERNSSVAKRNATSSHNAVRMASFTRGAPHPFCFKFNRIPKCIDCEHMSASLVRATSFEDKHRNFRDKPLFPCFKILASQAVPNFRRLVTMRRASSHPSLF